MAALVALEAEVRRIVKDTGAGDNVIPLRLPC
jgi:hypothetical protein